VPFLAGLASHEREALIQQLLVRDVRRGEYIVRAGNPPNGLHLIEAGQFVVERSGQVVAHLDEGDFIGAMAMMTNNAAHDDVRAVTPSQVLTLPGIVFLELLRTHPEISTTITRVLQERSTYIARQHDVVEAIAQRGVRRGDRVFVREVERCPPDCRLCVTACTSRHGAPRLQHTGVAYGNILLLDSCRQCRVGAECVEACPENAIQWDGNRLVVSDACTGCGKCEQACNYDAITLQPLNRSWLGALQRSLQNIPLLPIHHSVQSHRAQKCDFCAGHTDMACVTACPIGAIKLVPVESIFPY
jgi:Fe-S-cluster-containing hydrogenase component 2